MNLLHPIALRVGPLPPSGAPALEVVLADGNRITVELDIKQASRLADRLREILDGRIHQRPESMRVLELPLGFQEEPDSGPPSGAHAVVPDLRADLQTEGVL